MRPVDPEKLSLKLRKRFDIVKALGSGASATVFLAVDREYGDYQVALKVLRTDTDYDLNAVQRFCEEYRVLCNTQHQNLVEAYALVEDTNHLAYTMEYIPGRSLLEVATIDKLPVEKTVLIVSQILAALQALHENGIVHRDIKLENILLRDDGLAKLSDLGLLKSHGRHSMTRTGVLLGTVHYLPPEYVRHGIYDVQSDLYAVGLLLYECLIGRRWLETKDSAEALRMVTDQEFAFPKLALAGLPPKFRRILECALSTESRHRFRSAAEMRTAVLSETGSTEKETIVAAQETGAFSRDFFAAQALSQLSRNNRRRRFSIAAVGGTVAASFTLLFAFIGSPSVPLLAPSQVTSAPASTKWRGPLTGNKATPVIVEIDGDGKIFTIVGLAKADSSCAQLDRLVVDVPAPCNKNVSALLKKSTSHFQLELLQKNGSKTTSLRTAQLLPIIQPG